MSKTPEGGDWVLQYSFKTVGGDLVNVRGAHGQQFSEALAVLKQEIETGSIKEIAALLNPPRAAAPTSTGTKTNAPRPTANVPDAGAMPVGDAFVVTVNVDKVYARKDTGRTKTYPDGNERRVFKPGTVVATNGKKYDSFSDEDLAVAQEAKNTNQRVNVMYKVNTNGDYTSNTITKGGISIFGVVTEHAGMVAPGTAAGDEF